jgi:Flp pilus assembly secretin CpaC
MKNMMKVALCSGFLAMTLGIVPVLASDAIGVGIGQVSVVRSKVAIATLVVGDPAIADVVAEGENAVLVFGKKAGRTDLVLMGKDHSLLRRSPIVVGASAAGDAIIVRRPGANGIAQDAWVCAPACTKFTGE